MVMKICDSCGNEFDAKGVAKTCSPSCREIARRNYAENWKKRNAEHIAEYNRVNSEYIKARQKSYNAKTADQQKAYREANKEKIKKNLLFIGSIFK